MLDKIDTLEKARNYTFQILVIHKVYMELLHLDNIVSIEKSDESKNAFEVFSYALEQCPSISF